MKLKVSMIEKDRRAAPAGYAFTLIVGVSEKFLAFHGFKYFQSYIPFDHVNDT